MKVGDILKVKGSAVISIRPEQTIIDAAHIFKARRIGILVVSEVGGRVVGLLSERDLVCALAAYGDQASACIVGDIMTKKMVVCQPFDDAKQVMMTMKNGRFRHMPVMQDGAFKGLISIGDILHHLIEHDQLLHEKGILSSL